MNNRRNFLKILGTGFAAASANPIIAGVSKMKAPSRPLKVGILTPQSNICPQYPHSFANGLRLGIDQNKALQRQHIELVNEPNGFGTPFISKQNAQKLLYENGVDLMVGLISNEVVGQFDDLFQKKEVPMVVCNSGEHFPVQKLRENPFVFFNTLNLYQSAYQTGQLASTKYGKRGFIVTSLYDSGYDTLFGFLQGAESSGGTVEETLVMKVNETDNVTKAISRIREVAPDYIYVLLSGDQANDFIIQYHNENNDIPVFCSPFVTEGVNLPKLGKFAGGMTSITSWDKTANNLENKGFCKTYLETYRNEPDMFAVLGFETGLMIYQALANAAGNYSGKGLSQTLANVSLNSPRGRFTVDEKTGWTKTPLYHLEIDQQLLNSLPTPRIVEKLESVEATHADFAMLDNEYRTGWLNPYLFV